MMTSLSSGTADLQVRILLLLLAVIVAGCTGEPPPVLSPPVGPDNPAAPSANNPYRPVLAGTVDHGIGGRP
jgi:hypothetical protein